MATIETPQAWESDGENELVVTRESLESDASPRAARTLRRRFTASTSLAHELAPNNGSDTSTATSLEDDAAISNAPRWAAEARIERLLTWAIALAHAVGIWLRAETPLPRLWQAFRATSRRWLTSERPLPHTARRAAATLATRAAALLRRVNEETPWARAGLERNLTARQKVLRAGSITLLIGLTLFLLLNGPAVSVATLRSAGEALNTRLHPPKPQPTLAESGYIAVKSPPGAYNLSQISLAPMAGQPGAAWACWATPFSLQGQRGAWSARAYVTTSGGAHWNPLSLPQSAAVDCNALADSEQPASALFVLSQGLAPDGSCIAPFLYLTTNGGVGWTPIPWPLGPSAAACDFQMALQGGAIYVWSAQPLLRDLPPVAPPTGRLLVTRDAGQTWAPADNGLDDSAGLAVVGFRPGGRILATTTVRGAANGSSSTLMTSDDYGATWRDLGVLPGAFPQVYVSNDSNVTDHGGWGRLYELAETVANGQPSMPQQLYLATAYVGQGWTPLPLPPLGTDTTTSAQSRQPLVIGLGRGIVDAANSQLSPARLLWVWNPAHGEWLLDPQMIPGNLALQGATWHAGDQIYWMTTLQLGVPPVLQIYTKTLPADLLSHMVSGAARP